MKERLARYRDLVVGVASIDHVAREGLEQYRVDQDARDRVRCAVIAEPSRGGRATREAGDALAALFGAGTFGVNLSEFGEIAARFKALGYFANQLYRLLHPNIFFRLYKHVTQPELLRPGKFLSVLAAAAAAGFLKEFLPAGNLRAAMSKGREGVPKRQRRHLV